MNKICEDNYTILKEEHITVKIKPAKVGDSGMLQTIRQWTKSAEGLTEIQKYITGDTDLKTRGEAIRWWLMQLPNWGKVPEGIEIAMPTLFKINIKSDRSKPS